mmetsp:Transcript_3433/g.12233  ORF Transcript_3433/g.12233 Transcript_3433/m.12233 type:complete len:105 (+) Transcript_3433:2563-2877(+)
MFKGFIFHFAFFGSTLTNKRRRTRTVGAMALITTPVVASAGISDGAVALALFEAIRNAAMASGNTLFAVATNDTGFADKLAAMTDLTALMASFLSTERIASMTD